MEAVLVIRTCLESAAPAPRLAPCGTAALLAAALAQAAVAELLEALSPGTARPEMEIGDSSMTETDRTGEVSGEQCSNRE